MKGKSEHEFHSLQENKETFRQRGEKATVKNKMFGAFYTFKSKYYSK